MLIHRLFRHAPHFLTCSLFAAVLSACGGGDTMGTTSAVAEAASSADADTEASTRAMALSVSAKNATATGSSGTATYVPLVNENSNFTVSGTQTVRFGAGTSWITKSVTSSGACTNAFFGSDPDVGVYKSCQLVVSPTATTVAGASKTVTTLLTTEGNSFTVSGTQTVQFGANSSWITLSVTGSGWCTNGFFGYDPDPNVVKSCRLVSTEAVSGAPASTTATTVPTVTAWVRVASMGDAINMAATQPVRFGNGVSWVTKTAAPGDPCTVANFGTDPAPWTAEYCETQVTVAAVVQTGNAPVVNTALIPAPAVSYKTPRVQTLSAAQLAYAVYNPTATNVSAFRDGCNYSHMNFDDPIVYPGNPGASHMHTYMGNDQTSASSTAASISGSGGSTCAGGTLNRTAYWQPTLIDTRTGQPVVPNGSNMYYKQGYLGVVAGSMKPFPVGLRIIAGNPDTTGPTQSNERFACLNGVTWQSSIPSCAVGDTLLANVTFPQCWDGVNLDSPDHRSHMAYATGAGCPADHPVPLPEISVRFDYIVSEQNTGNFWRLSSDNYSGPGGYSLHADWFYGWDPATHMTFLTNCLNASMNCDDFLLGDGRMLY